jgi:hypothetical protein
MERARFASGFGGCLLHHVQGHQPNPGVGEPEELLAEGRLGGEPPAPGRNGERAPRGKPGGRSNATRRSTTDDDARLYRRQEAWLQKTPNM